MSFFAFDYHANNVACIFPQGLLSFDPTSDPFKSITMTTLGTEVEVQFGDKLQVRGGGRGCTDLFGAIQARAEGSLTPLFRDTSPSKTILPY
jgi:hypothetical protein